MERHHSDCLKSGNDEIAEHNEGAAWLKTNCLGFIKGAMKNAAFVTKTDWEGEPGSDLICQLSATTLTRRACDADSMDLWRKMED